MPDYKSMYFRLFNRVSDIISILQEAQQEAENAYIEDNPPVLKLAEGKKEERREAD